MSKLDDFIAKLFDRSATISEARDIVGHALDDETSGTWHPYGFGVIPLHAIEKTTLRLHIWPEPRNTEIKESRIHKHDWKLTSMVVSGALTQKEWAVESSDQGSHFHYSIRYLDETTKSILLPQLAKPVLSKTKVISAGEIYGMNVQDFHSTLPSTPSISLVLSEKIEGEFAEVLSPTEFDAETMNLRRNLLTFHQFRDFWEAQKFD